MSKPKTYQDILSSRIINARPATIAKKLGVSIITAEWLKTMVKEHRQEIVKNEIEKVTTDDIARKLKLPLELATWIREEIDKRARL